jgi:stage V sporulation protein D (sporulation-specific penicillin-binding protein)
MFAIMFLISVVLYLKIIKGEEFEQLAINQLVSSESYDRVIKPNRGSILDRFGHSLATSTTVYDVILDVKLITGDNIDEEDREGSLIALNEILNIPMDELHGYVRDDPSNELLKSHYFKAAYGISKETADKIRDKDLTGVFLEEDSFRTYMNNNFASHLIGFIRTNGEKWGVEKYYDEYLSGKEGRSLRLYTDLYESDIRVTPPEHGDKITLTLDKSIQEISEEVANKIGSDLAPLSASVISMDVNSGEVLSWGQYPNFDLNDPSNISGINDAILEAQWDSLDDAQKTQGILKLWRDVNLSDTFEPGSIYKPIVVSAALEEGVIEEGRVFYCSGEKWFGSQRIPCHLESGHGSQNLDQALANSCNVAMMEIIHDLGAEKYYKYQREFGFGEKTGIDLPSEESSANLVNTLDQLKHSVYLATNSMGQGFNVTPIQMLAAFSATVNGGSLMKPYVVSKITDKDNKVTLSNSPELLRKVISQDVSDRMRGMLTYVIDWPYGTGRLAKIEGYKIGGKTGTAQQGVREDEKYAYSFIGYLTEEDPQVAVLISINQPQGKEIANPSAVPYFKEFMLSLIKYKGIKPTTESGSSDEIGLGNSSVELPDLKGETLTGAINILNNLGIDYEFAGSEGSVVESTIPLPGVRVQPNNTKITVYIKKASEGDELVPVPDVIGANESYAAEILRGEGLEPLIAQSSYGEAVENISDSPTTFYDMEEGAGQTGQEPVAEKNIISQMPNPETLVPKGTIIKLKTR